MNITYLKKINLFIYCTILIFQVSSLQDITQHAKWKLLNGDKCGESETCRILKDDPAEPGEFPWMARLVYGNSMVSAIQLVFLCGGVLINENYVLTAAHCVINVTLTSVMVRLGEVDLTVDNQLLQNGGHVQEIRIRKSQTFIHKNYSEITTKHDIALLRLDKPATINTFVKPICLSTIQTSSGVELDVIGWGPIDSWAKIMTSKLLRGSVSIVPPKDCNSYYQNFYCTNYKDGCGVMVGPEQLCAVGMRGHIPCHGDSGGPLMIAAPFNQLPVPRYYLIGLVSIVPKPCGYGPGAYTDVDYHLQWILDHIQP